MEKILLNASTSKLQSVLNENNKELSKSIKNIAFHSEMIEKYNLQEDKENLKLWSDIKYTCEETIKNITEVLTMRGI